MRVNNSQQQKVTSLIVILFINAISACTSLDDAELRIAFQQSVDSLASVSIDSAYRQVNASCDSLQQIRIPIMVDSLLKADTLKAQTDAGNR